MATRKQGLQKDVFAIFGDAPLPRDLRLRRPSTDDESPKARAGSGPEAGGKGPLESGRSAATSVADPPAKKKKAADRDKPRGRRSSLRKSAPEVTETGASAEATTVSPPRGKTEQASEANTRIEAPPATSDPGVKEEAKPLDLEPLAGEVSVEQAEGAADEEETIGEDLTAGEIPDETHVSADDAPAPSATGLEAARTCHALTESETEVAETSGRKETAAQAVEKTARPRRAESKPRELPPLGSIAFLERVKKTMHCPKNFECCADRFIDICKAKVSRNGKQVICLEGRHCGCRFQSGSLFKRICNCSMRQHIAREYGY